MAGSLVKRITWAAIPVALLAGGAVAALPYFASTQIVRTRIAQELSDWSGYRVRLGGQPVITVWPSLSATLPDVSFVRWGASENARPVLTAERIDVGLSAFSAITGELSLNRVAMVRPILRLIPVGETEVRLDVAAGGRMMRAIATATEAIRTDPVRPNLDAIASDAFGTVDFSDGRVVVARSAGDQELLSGLSGSVEWPALNRTGAIVANGIWRGEAVKLSLRAERPLILLAGGNGQLSLSIESAPLTAKFDGRASATLTPDIDGSLQLSSPSLRRAIEWAGVEIASGPPVGAAAISGHVIGGSRRFKFEDTRIEIGGNPGRGALEVDLNQKIPAINGTLAFDAVDLGAVLNTFRGLPLQPATEGDAIDTTLAGHAALDLRLSAAKATLGPINLANVAASAQMRPDLAAFDISDASAFGGSIQLGIRVDRRPEGNMGEARLLASDVDGALLAKAAGTNVFPAARGMISVILKSPLDSWDEVLRSADGTISAKFGAGRFDGFDLDAFLAQWGKTGFFPLDAVAGGSTPIDGAELKAQVTDGVARLENARIAAGKRSAVVTGLFPSAGQGIALSGTISDISTTPARDSTFFVGGTWTDPFIAPIPTQPTIQ